jgi:DNA-binding beta-propeller fold protein YncE
MSASGRRAIGFLFVPVLAMAALGLLALWGIRSFLAGPAPIRDVTPTQLASVSVPSRPSSLAWSADRAYLAAGTGGGDVFIVDVAKASVTSKFKVAGWVQALAFSPDGQWLTVATRQPGPAGAATAELVVFDAPAFTPRFTAKTNRGDGFSDLAWAADSKALYAIEDPEPRPKEQKAAVRRWAVPAFAEQSAITAPQVYRYEAIAVSPDGGTLAVADVGQGIDGKIHLVRLLNLANGAERTSFRAAPAGNAPPRLGFTRDSKAVGVFDTDRLSWWDVVTGGSASPDPVSFAIQPAALSDSRNVASADGRWWAEGYGRRRDFADIGAGWDRRENEFGAFVRVTERATAKTWGWRVGQGDPPALAFSPDGTTLAGTVTQSSGESIVIWAVPK